MNCDTLNAYKNKVYLYTFKGVIHFLPSTKAPQLKLFM